MSIKITLVKTLQEIASLAIPLLFTLLLNSLIGLTDMYLAGYIGKSAQAAVGIAEQIWLISILLGTGLSSGVSSCVARCIGAKDNKTAKFYAKNGLSIAFLIGTITTILGLVASQHIFTWFGAGQDVAKLGSPYLFCASLANLPFILVQCQNAIMRSISKTTYCFLQWLIIATFSIIGSLILFLTKNTPAYLSLVTLGYTWDTACIAGLAFGMFMLKRYWHSIESNNVAITSPANSFRQTKQQITHILTIGMPVIFTELCWLGTNLVTYKLLAFLPNSVELQAAWSIKSKIEDTFSSSLLLSISLAAATMVARKLGAGQINHARSSALLAAGLGTILMLVVGTILKLNSHNLATCFSNVPEVVSHATWLINGSAVYLPLTALWLIICGALEGAGYTRIPLLLTFIGLFCIRLPLTILFTIFIQISTAGIWLALLFSSIFLVFGAVKIFKQGRWAIPSLSQIDNHNI